jgi:hypothetical protein
MSRNSLELADLRGLSPEATAARVRRFVRNSRPLNGELREIDAAINAYETRYEMSSSIMCQRLRDTGLEHTADVCRWQMLLEMRDRVSKSS